MNQITIKAAEIRDIKWVRELFERHHITMSPAEVLKRYGEKHRHFHTFKHILDIVSRIRSMKIRASERDLLLMIALFHDIVYDPRRGDNEERSAEMFMKNADCEPRFATLVHDAIIDTKAHQGRSAISRLFCSLDMSVVSSDYDGLLEWERGIHGEYGFVGNDAYKAGRLAFLKQAYIDYADNSENLARLIEYVEKTY